MISLQPNIACICEGGAEATIINILLDNDKLCFSRENLIDEEILRCRNASTFETRYLRKEYNSKISVIRILDSKRERFSLSKAYKDKVSEIINVYTSPEIEMLIVICEGKYKEYKKSGKKPSNFCKENLKMKDVKKPDFIKNFFKDVDLLTDAIREYSRIYKKCSGEHNIADLLRQ